MRYSDIDPGDINPDTGRPYSNYSSPSLDAYWTDDDDAEDGELEDEEDAAPYYATMSDVGDY